jgi:hypothetical protein
MNHDIRFTGLAAMVALAVLIVALGLATFEAAAPEYDSVFPDGTPVPVVQRAEASAPFQASDPSVCSSPGSDPGNCTYQ